MPGSTPEKPINCEVDLDLGNIAGKTVIVTGGASGLGEAYIRTLHAAKANVVIGDSNPKTGEKLASELAGAKYIQVDVTKWQDQLHLFRQAELAFGQIHYVIANAGIATQDDVFSFDGPDSVPTEPGLDIIHVNIIGVLYTTKLAMHYFIKLNGTTRSPKQVDTCLILIGSGAAFLDCPRGPQYSCSKWGMRGIMHSLRRTAGLHGSRVNVLSPWYVRTNILTKETFDHVESAGVHIAKTEDAGQALLRLLSDTSINGRMLFIAPRKWAASGYVDLDIDEYPEVSLLNEIQEDQIKPAPISLGLFTS
ncbi:hypothetical protein C7974DRAFT_227586 [Boeremia exigua]|uniref:uncharacterized protein n=1 Tax=Boeremia exigua TaxID=749465 RepID=UPI001E8D4642|nr:uncharacterized protein C7974DRAFT_227586 [Boeremia exigua]KAH6620184.1 hypothetical protein C7974DRAFT_227586 [Boeremia exigua]